METILLSALILCATQPAACTTQIRPNLIAIEVCDVAPSNPKLALGPALIRNDSTGQWYSLTIKGRCRQA